MEAPTKVDGFVFAPPVPGTWSSASFTEANHEAAHAAVAVLLGVTVREARIDRPEPGVLGHVALERHSDLWRHAAVAIAPSAMDGSAPPRPDLMAADGDLWSASASWWDAGEDRPEWATLVAIAREVLRSPTGRRAVMAVSSALLREGALPGCRVKELVREATEAAVPA